MPRQKHAPTTPLAHTPRAQHKPFSWISDEAKDFPLADFAALSMDICNGIQTCLELVHDANLERDFRADGDSEAIPVIDAAKSSYLLRLAMASSHLLAEEAERRIAWINGFGASQMNASRGVGHE